jgi:hypothetical protein
MFPNYHCLALCVRQLMEAGGWVCWDGGVEIVCVIIGQVSSVCMCMVFSSPQTPFVMGRTNTTGTIKEYTTQSCNGHFLAYIQSYW